MHSSPFLVKCMKPGLGVHLHDEQGLVVPLDEQLRVEAVPQDGTPRNVVLSALQVLRPDAHGGDAREAREGSCEPGDRVSTVLRRGLSGGRRGARTL